MSGVFTPGFTQITAPTGLEQLPCDTGAVNGIIPESGWISIGQFGVGPVQAFGNTAAGTVNTNLALGPLVTMTLTGNITLANPTNPVVGATYTWLFTQDGVGSRTLTLGSNFRTAGGAPVLTTTAGATDMYRAVWDGTKFDGVMSKALA